METNYTFNCDVDEIRLQRALRATKNWQPASESRCWQVLYSRMRRGEQPDAWLVTTYEIFSVALPDVKPARPIIVAPFLRPRESTHDVPADAQRVLANAKRRARALNQKLQAKDQCPELED